LIFGLLRSPRQGFETNGPDLTDATQITIRVNEASAVSGLLLVPRKAVAVYVIAHGAGAGMTHPFMTAVADGLAERRVATLRYQFPYMERGSKRPDRPAVAHATVRAAVEAALQLVPALPIFAGGKSFGGRMTSQAQAEEPLPNVAGLIFFGFPLHPANRPSADRARHLSDVAVPMLFLQGTRDALADIALLDRTIVGLRGAATLVPVDGADHSFHVLARSGRTDAQVLNELLDALVGWIGKTMPRNALRGR
jgi:predicted alpha/beta-hydrolase family hydrolase